jgi:hypothetical protein
MELEIRRVRGLCFLIGSAVYDCSAARWTTVQRILVMLFWTVTVCHGGRLFHNWTVSITKLFGLLWSDKLVSFVVLVGDEAIRGMLGISM